MLHVLIVGCTTHVDISKETYEIIARHETDRDKILITCHQTIDDAKEELSKQVGNTSLILVSKESNNSFPINDIRLDYELNPFVLSKCDYDYLPELVDRDIDEQRYRNNHFNRIQAHKFNNYTPHVNVKTVVTESRHRRTPRVKTSNKDRVKSQNYRWSKR